MANAERNELDKIYFPGESAITEGQYRVGHMAVAASGDPGEYARQQIAETFKMRDDNRADLDLPDITSAVAAKQQNWRPKSACRDSNLSDLFFPPAHYERKDDREEREAKAKRICQTCPVKKQCLDFALSTKEPDGIWGGLTAAERRKIAK